MRGQITYFSDSDKSGEVKGEDGQRYRFTLDNLLFENTLRYLAQVHFEVRDGRAVAVDILGDDGLSIGGGPEGIEDNLSMWGFFKRAMSRRYFDFEGRARRKEYWSFTLFYALSFLLLYCVMTILKEVPNPQVAGSSVVISLALILLVYFIPSLSVLVRRLHDIGLSGWFVLLFFVPYVGSLVLLAMTLWPSGEGRNAYGPAPLYNKKSAEENFDL